MILLAIIKIGKTLNLKIRNKFFAQDVKNRQYCNTIILMILDSIYVLTLPSQTKNHYEIY
ncbi:hypothetical protein NIES4071_16880 [Calothrix sp. NIES-4071]|nr:hypothetical protein NIES4071_16880 [Calothrix sp. NIES-4071]BAZ56021.1 hypothetical protein NIES4105_16830 [Calothrix sp. NIES-4105]